VGPRLEENKAKIATQSEIIEFVLNFFNTTHDLEGLNFLITAGPSREMVDTVRFISNASSGKMGMAFAQSILYRGGKVTIIYGPGTAIPPSNATVVNVISAQDFVDTVQRELNNSKYDILISAAAIGDFTPIETADDKISSSQAELVIKLTRTPKVLDLAREMDSELYIVAFKAETTTEEHMIDKAYDRLQSGDVDLIIANNVSAENTDRGFASDTNEVFVIDKEKQITHIPLASKLEIANKILDIILPKFNEKKGI
jgi:phosphopantothenoylcysteine decarboxylase/phosphopantothenate--cysteine ligase